MKILILILSMFLLSAPVFAQPDPKRVPPHSRPKPPPAETAPLPETEYIPLDAKAAPCQTTAANAPIIGGVKLGLSPDELGKSLKIKITPGAPNKIGSSIFQIDKTNKSALPNGINFIKLAFFDNRLFVAEIYIDNAAPPKTVDKFALSLSEKYGISKAWFKTAARVGKAEPKMSVEERYVYLFCPGELRFTINDAGENGFKLEMLDLKIKTR